MLYSLQFLGFFFKTPNCNYKQIWQQHYDSPLALPDVKQWLQIWMERAEK